MHPGSIDTFLITQPLEKDIYYCTLNMIFFSITNFTKPSTQHFLIMNNIHNSGLLICIEGIDGSGKSTLARMLHESLLHKGYSVVLTKEPGGSALGKTLRTILQEQPVAINPISEFLLFAADRAQHITQIVKPALSKGYIVISDRMADSSLVYQGYGRGINKEHVKAVNSWVLQGIKPNVTIYVRIDQETAEQRISARGTRSAFEKEQASFVSRLIEGFDTIYHNQQDVIHIDGSQSVESVLHATLIGLAPWLNSIKQ